MDEAENHGFSGGGKALLCLTHGYVSRLIIQKYLELNLIFSEKMIE